MSHYATSELQVSEQNILSFDVHWAPGGIRVGGDRMHQSYLDRMAKQVTEVMRRKLLMSFGETAHAQDGNSRLFDEVSQHVGFYQER